VFKGEYSDRIITLFDNQHFAHFVDAVHVDDTLYLTKNFTKLPHQLVYVHQFDKRYDLTFGKVSDYEKLKTPDFIVYFDELEEVDVSDW
jgi:hypothetical protein